MTPTNVNLDERVRRLWLYLHNHDHSPCSVATAARIATEVRGEFWFANLSNETVVTEHSARLADAGVLMSVGMHPDPDGIDRAWYILRKVSDPPPPKQN